MLTKLFINKPVFSIQHYINKPLSGSISQHSGKSYALLKSCKSPLLLPIAQIKNTLLPPWHPLLIFKGECIRWHRRFEVLNFVGFFFLAALDLRCCARPFSSCERGLLFLAVRGLLIAVASLVAEHGL